MNLFEPCPDVQSIGVSAVKIHYTMTQKTMIHEFSFKGGLQYENSFGVIRWADNVSIHATIGIRDEDGGWFEIYDIETGGEDWHAEGGLWFDGMNVTDYDGVFALHPLILKKLEELGYNVDDVRCD